MPGIPSSRNSSTARRASPRSWATALMLGAGLTLPAHASRATVVWDQSDVETLQVSPSISELIVTTDFTLAGPTTLRAFSVWLHDATTLGGDGLATGIFTSFSGNLSWSIFSDAAGRPSVVLASGAASAISVTDTGLDTVNENIEDIFRVDGTIAPGVLLPAGTYWFSVSESPVFDGTGIRWAAAIAQTGAPAYANPGDVSYDDRALVLFDEVPAVPAPTPALVLLTSLAALHGLRRGQRRA